LAGWLAAVLQQFSGAIGIFNHHGGRTPAGEQANGFSSQSFEVVEQGSSAAVVNGGGDSLCVVSGCVYLI